MGTEACSLPLAHDYPEFLKASQSKPPLAVSGVCIAPWMPEAAGKETEAWGAGSVSGGPADQRGLTEFR